MKASERLREEDPHTDRWTRISPNRLISHRSRFEADLNRPRESAVYLKPEDAWGLTLWKTPPPAREIKRSLAFYDDFYAVAHQLLSSVQRQFGSFVVFDLHTYNHRRDGPDAPAASPDGNPEVNVGTGTLRDRARWAPLIDAFIAALRDHDFDGRGRHLDVRENVRFRGGHFSQWVHESFPASGLSLALEFKKFFMDEWTGMADQFQVELIARALESTVPMVLESLRQP
jgi:N-formylglutamate amidohydrolase